jgi:hypothetical protein
MLLFVPEEASLRLEAGYLSMNRGKLRAAAAHFDRVIAEGDGVLRHRAAALLQQLRSQMN